MVWKQIKKFFNPKYEDNAWGDWVELNKKYIQDTKENCILDAGCGTGYGSAIRHFKSIKKNGCDIDKDFACKKYLDNWICCSVEELSFKAETFQAVTSNWVLEHVEKPQKTIDETYRIIKNGGYFLFRTPNIFNYAILLSHLTSTRFHNKIRRLNVKSEEAHVDNVPTYYFANTKRRLKQYLEKSGFDIIELDYQGTAAEYLTFFRLFYIIGKIGDLITNLFFLRWLKKNIVCVAKKNEH
ncbi:MAG: class I SAM-dependent methyltransferase [bacterium]